ncbi:bilirubin oxidase [Paraburkholderia phenazinium]|uniref:Bilirubin oxidase n=1 Tax=Paraburkholderia phenazinium TaxID=60549 RepID=A0A1G7XK83_9BURK|nr:multicopper oxidase family protein [Paraburkholderia phenazinium]SDG84638.1 bilirubin oxidase [Paraburkholderia phenazinium]
MIRREFLVRALSAAAASVFAREAFAQQGQQGAHSMHGMSDMSGMQGMRNSSGMPDMPGGGMPPSVQLAAPDALPAGAPLAALRTLPNESGEPGLFRATLVAQPAQHTLIAGHPTTFWQYGPAGGQPAEGAGNGPASAQPGSLVVGPLIDVREGDTVEIRFVNRLPEPSTIHWHGLPVPPDQDGNPSDPVAPGGSRVYRFTLPRGSAGTYWYHPHPHGQSAEQVFRGLAGPFVVRAADDPLAAWPERHLFFSDLKLASDGAIPPNDMMDWMNGREGQFVLVNGARRPLIVVTTDERWRIWNGCNARYLRLSLGEGRVFTQVGTDGGLLEQPRAGLTTLLLAPGERAELMVSAAGASGEAAQAQQSAQSRQLATSAQTARAILTAEVYDRRKMAMSHGSLPPNPALPLADVQFEPDSADTTQVARVLPASLRVIAPLGAPAARKSVVFSERMDMAAMHHTGRPVTGGLPGGLPTGMSFMINGATFDPRRITLTSRRGEVEHWSIENRTDMDHPFHLHGTQFQVLEREQGGVAALEPYRAWRDTVNVQPGETVRIATVQQQAGRRMFHCHILEHEDLGMMGTLKVI